jgi:hypothetical protein
VFAQPGKPLRRSPPPAIALRRTAAGPGTMATTPANRRASGPHAPRSGKRFLPTYLSFNKKQVTGRGESRRFFQEKTDVPLFPHPLFPGIQHVAKGSWCAVFRKFKN